MDTTRTEELLTQLESADPAKAPDIADELTATLAEELDGGAPLAGADTESPSPVTNGGTL